MGIEAISNNPELLRAWIKDRKREEEEYTRSNPESLIPLFAEELRNLGFEFELNSQIKGLITKHKDSIVPIAIKYYQLAKTRGKTNEQDYFLSFFYIKGLDVIVPMLLDDYYSKTTADLTRWFISDCIYTIGSPKYIQDYLNIVSNKEFGNNRKMIILLLGKLKKESAIPVLIGLLEDEDVRLQAICALGQFKREEFRCYFERFQDSPNPGWRKYAREALKKIR